MGKLTALVVEDDVDIAYIYRRALQLAGFEVEVAETGGQALTMLSSRAPTLVVLDVSLPEVSGPEVLENIRRDPRLAKTCVIMATAYSHVDSAIRDKSDLVLLKPISYIQLRDLSKRLVATAAV